ncbi:hypothetical protein, partial [Pararhizobium sp. PWRC1-1]|uniref:hypothetical protein n=1 Tax=Pararhizobium sp. PWRC1-1 TaxID=2804566 RepID=UPI003CF12EEE
MLATLKQVTIGISAIDGHGFVYRDALDCRFKFNWQSALVHRSATGHHSVFDALLISLLPSVPRNEWISSVRRRAF